MLERCPTSATLASCITSAQQKGAQLPLLQIKDQVNRRLASVVFGVHISSSVDQKGAQLRVFLTNGLVQRCVTVDGALRVHISAPVKQKGAQPFVRFSHSTVKRCLVAIFRIHITSPVKQEGTELRALVLEAKSKVKRCLIVLVFAVNLMSSTPSPSSSIRISSTFEQKGAHLCVFLTNGVVQRCVAEIVFHMHISSPGKQKGTHRSVFLGRGLWERRYTCANFALSDSLVSGGVVKRCRIAVIFGIHVSSAVEEKGTQLGAVHLDGVVKRRLIFWSFGIHVSSSVKQNCTQLCVLRTDSVVKSGRYRIDIVFGIHISSTVEQKCTQLYVLLTNSIVKWRLTAESRMFHTTSSTSVEQEGAQLDVLLLGSRVKRRAQTRTTDDTGIKIQPTDTQVSVSRRGNKPFPVDGTTLLT